MQVDGNRRAIAANPEQRRATFNQGIEDLNQGFNGLQLNADLNLDVGNRY